jgi:hypothetical protein
MALIVVASTTTAGAATASGTSAAAARSAGTATIGFGTRFVDIQGAAAKLFPIQSRDGLLGFGRVGHFYERKSAGASSVPIGHYADLVDFAVGFKQGAELGFGGAVREVANKKLLHGFPFPVSQRKTSGLVGGFDNQQAAFSGEGTGRIASAMFLRG